MPSVENPDLYGEQLSGEPHTHNHVTAIHLVTHPSALRAHLSSMHGEPDPPSTALALTKLHAELHAEAAETTDMRGRIEGQLRGLKVEYHDRMMAEGTAAEQEAPLAVDQREPILIHADFPLTVQQADALRARITEALEERDHLREENHRLTVQNHNLRTQLNAISEYEREAVERDKR